MDKGWKTRHDAAFDAIRLTGPGVGVMRSKARNVGGAVVVLIKGWVLLAEQHEEAFGTRIGDDGFAGEPWCSMGCQIHEMLNLKTGLHLDCGTLSSLMYATLKKHAGREDFSIAV